MVKTTQGSDEIMKSVSSQIDRMDTTIFILFILLLIILGGVLYLIKQGRIVVNPQHTSPPKEKKENNTNNNNYNIPPINLDIIHKIHTSILGLETKLQEIISKISDEHLDTNNRIHKLESNHSDLVILLKDIQHDIEYIKQKTNLIEELITEIESNLEAEYNKDKEIKF